jgi:hypothetical protein
MLKFLIRGGGGYEETILVAYSETPDNTTPGNGSVHHWNNITQFTFKNTNRG